MIKARSMLPAEKEEASVKSATDTKLHSAQVNVSSTKCEKDSFRQTLVYRNPHSLVAEFLTPLPYCFRSVVRLGTRSASFWDAA